MNKRLPAAAQDDADLCPSGQGDLVLDTSKDGLAHFHLCADGNALGRATVKDWLTAQAGRECRVGRSADGGACAS